MAPGFKLIAVPVTPAAEASIENQRPETAELTLQSAMRAWIKNLEKRVANGDLSEEYLLHIKSVTAKRIRELMPDYELKKIGKPELSEIRMAFQSRKTWGRITVEKELRNVITFFNWLDDSELWPTPPRKWERSLRPVFQNVHVDESPCEKAHDTYTMAELTKLYQSAGYSMRLWILLVLNFAWGQTEIATALCNHFSREKPELRRVRRYRHKRKPGTITIPGHWQAWPETWEAAIQRIDKCSIPVAPKRVAFLTAQNQPLVRIVGKKRYDAIGEAFSSLCKVAGVRDRGFYLLRHTGINLVKKISNSEMADLYSQHAPVTVSQKFYENADWKELRKVLRRLRRKLLEPMFDAAISARDQAIEADHGDGSVVNCP